MIVRYIIIIASMVQAFAYSKGPLNGSPLQIKVQMLRDRHLVLREPWLVMGGWFEEAQMFEGAHTHTYIHIVAGRS